MSEKRYGGLTRDEAVEHLLDVLGAFLDANRLPETGNAFIAYVKDMAAEIEELEAENARLRAVAGAAKSCANNPWAAFGNMTIALRDAGMLEGE